MKKKRLMTDKTGELQEQYLESAARQLADEMDAEVMRSMLIECGWHEVKLWVMTHEQGRELDEWVKDNIQGGFWTRGLIWLFKEDRDAMWFKLRWLS